MTAHWPPGTPIILREISHGQVWSGRPVIVVEDSADLLALYMPEDTRWAQPRNPDGSPVWLRPREWMLRERVWAGGSTLRLATPGAAHSVLAFHDEHGAFQHWYINLEEPFRRTPFGFDYLDHLLDIVVQPDRTRWEWKDEEEFAQAQATGIFTSEQARAIRAEGERALAHLRANRPPFDRGWEQWRPSLGWPIPILPQDWDVIEE